MVQQAHDVPQGGYSGVWLTPFCCIKSREIWCVLKPEIFIFCSLRQNLSYCLKKQNRSESFVDLNVHHILNYMHTDMLGLL